MESILPECKPCNADPTAYLPHRSPFLLIDRVLSRDPGQGASGEKCVTHDANGYPAEVFLLESMAQLGGIAAADREGEGGFLAAIDRARFHRRVRAGDRIVITVCIVKSFGRLYLLEGEARVDSELVATAALTLGIGMISG
jgi:3-hydroxyacyl-[acyl-carrier-protein] dehydratase